LLEKPENLIEEINKSEVKISYYKDSGKGGQHRNKTLSGVRLQYKDFKIECCDTRDQYKNKEIAFERLREKIKYEEVQKIDKKIQDQYSKQNTNKGKRGNFTRNYSFIRNEIAQDKTKTSLKSFLKGNLDSLYEK